jgi:inner membrane protein
MPFESTFWHWWVLAFALFALESFVPGAFFLWMGVAGILTGILAWIVPGIGFLLEGLFFSLMSVVSVLAWRTYQKARPTKTQDTTLNRRGQQYVGKILTLSEDLKGGRGHTKVDDSLWSIEGPDMRRGTQIIILEAKGTTFIVAPHPSEKGPVT